MGSKLIPYDSSNNLMVTVNMDPVYKCVLSSCRVILLLVQLILFRIVVCDQVMADGCYSVLSFYLSIVFLDFLVSDYQIIIGMSLE